MVVVYGHVKNFGCGKIWWGIDFLLWDIDFFGCMGIFGLVILVMGTFWTCDSGHGKFFGHVVLIIGIFRTCDFSHGKFWTCDFFDHVETFDRPQTK